MRLQNITLLAGLGMLAVMLQGCPKEKIDVPCYLNNIVVRNGLRVTPARDSLRFGDTLWISSSVYRHVRDNNNQPIDLNNKGLNSYLSFGKRNPTLNEVLRPEDFKLVLLAGSLGETKMYSSIHFHARLNYELVGDSMKLLAGFVPQRKGIFEIKGTEAYISPGGQWFSTAFYQNGSCYQGVLNDSFTTPNRHWYLYYGAGTTYNSPQAYYVNFY